MGSALMRAQAAGRPDETHEARIRAAAAFMEQHQLSIKSVPRDDWWRDLARLAWLSFSESEARALQVDAGCAGTKLDDWLKDEGIAADCDALARQRLAVLLRENEGSES